MWARLENQLDEPRKCSPGLWQVEQELLLEPGPWLLIRIFTPQGYKGLGEKQHHSQWVKHTAAPHKSQLSDKILRSPHPW